MAIPLAHPTLHSKEKLSFVEEVSRGINNGKIFFSGRISKKLSSESLNQWPYTKWGRLVHISTNMELREVNCSLNFHKLFYVICILPLDFSSYPLLGIQSDLKFVNHFIYVLNRTIISEEVFLSFICSLIDHVLKKLSAKDSMLRDCSIVLAKFLNLTISCSELTDCMISCLMGSDSNCRSMLRTSKTAEHLLGTNINLNPVNLPSLPA